ncbi:MAG: cellulose synthase subunit BcsC-related outer membrane protein [Zymomonas mobilis]|uniref:Putative negative regulator of RcsB-dependent stress response n=1 Tax=Zymomonas mobilis TaxID=542 RepID=A0A542W1K7_ZYMMB|nr:cellulose synthase subunit BcsC-related outer membrane protein [Zymomonas mobilis]TQL17471.1 putative negative regulator of RcsB-dependent stress response [Zymomonas mobilis]
MKRITGITLASSLAGAMMLGSLAVDPLPASVSKNPTTGKNAGASKTGATTGSGSAIQLLRNQAVFWKNRGRNDLAANAWQRLLEIDPNNKMAKQALQETTFVPAAPENDNSASLPSSSAKSKNIVTGQGGRSFPTGLTPSARAGRIRLEGFNAFQNNQLDLAEQRFRRALALYAHDKDALGGLGIIRLKQHRYPDAIRFLEEASSDKEGWRWANALSSARFYGRFDEAQAASRSNQLDKAQSILEQLQGQQGGDQTVSNALLADIYARQGQYDKAMALYDKLGSSADAVTVARLRSQENGIKARKALSQGDYAHAEQYFRTAIVNDIANPWLRLDYARLLLKEGHRPEAVSLIRPLEDQASSEEAIYAASLFWQEMGDNSHVINLVNRIPDDARTPLMNKIAEDADINIALSRAKRMSLYGRRGDAIGLLRSLANDPNRNISQLGLISDSLLQLGDVEDAAFLAEHSLSLPLGAASDYQASLSVLIRTGHYDTASDFINQIAPEMSRHDQNGYKMLNRTLAIARADMMRQKKLYMPAFDVLHQAWEETDGGDNILPVLARIYQDAGLNDKAQSLYHYMLSNHPRDASALLNSLTIAQQQGNDDRAEQALRRLKKVAPGNPYVYLASARFEKNKSDDEQALKDLKKAHRVYQRMLRQGRSADLPSDNAASDDNTAIIVDAPNKPRGDYNPFALNEEDFRRLQTRSEVEMASSDNDAEMNHDDYHYNHDDYDDGFGQSSFRSSRYNNNSGSNSAYQKKVTAPVTQQAAGFSSHPLFASSDEDDNRSNRIVENTSSRRVSHAGKQASANAGRSYGEETAPRSNSKTQPAQPLLVNNFTSTQNALPFPNQTTGSRSSGNGLDNLNTRVFPDHNLSNDYDDEDDRQEKIKKDLAEQKKFDSWNIFAPGSAFGSSTMLEAPSYTSIAVADPINYPAAARLHGGSHDPLLRDINDGIDHLSLNTGTVLEGTPEFREHSGQQGLSRLNEYGFNAKASTNLGSRVRGFFSVTPLYLTAGQPDQYGAPYFGGNPLKSNSSIAAGGKAMFVPIKDQSASGVALDAGIKIKDIRLDIGTTPIGFRKTNIQGGISWSPSITDHLSGHIFMERRPVMDSLVAYAGTLDPVTGQTWGSVMKTGGGGGLSYDVNGSGLYAQGNYRVYDGTRVQKNHAVEANVGGYYSLLNSQSANFSIGVNVNYQHYLNNQYFFSFGQGGYFSPNHFISVAFPLRYTGTLDRWKLNAEIAPGYQDFYERRNYIFGNRHDQQNQMNTFYMLNNDLSNIFPGQHHSGAGYEGRLSVSYRLSRAAVLGGEIRATTFGPYSEYRELLSLHYSLDAEKK